MESEHNNISKLKRKLPQHRAPDSVWDSVDDKIHLIEKSHRNLNKAINGLPVYNTPDQVWTYIEKELRKTRGAILFSNWFLKVAAVLILVLAISLLIRDWYLDENANTLAVVDKPVWFNMNDQLEEQPVLSENMPDKTTSTDLQTGMKQKQLPPKKKIFNERDAIDKIELVSMSSIKIDKLEEDIPKGTTRLSQNKTDQKAKSIGQPKINRIKLIVHNDPPMREEEKKKITFALFRPVSYSTPKKDTSNKDKKPILAAKINL